MLAEVGVEADRLQATLVPTVVIHDAIDHPTVTIIAAVTMMTKMMMSK